MASPIHMHADITVYMIIIILAYLHIATETKWLLFCRWHFQSRFLSWKLLHFDLNFTKICSNGCKNKQTPALIQKTSWYQTVAPLSAPIVAEFIDTCLKALDELICFYLPLHCRYNCRINSSGVILCCNFVNDLIKIYYVS